MRSDHEQNKIKKKKKATSFIIEKQYSVHG